MALGFDLEYCSAWRDYLELCKPRVVLLMLLTALVGMLLAAQSTLPLEKMLLALIGIALCAGSAAAINHLVDQRIDAIMDRTRNRPLVQGNISQLQAAIFALGIGSLGFSLLLFYINSLTAILTLLSLIGYAVIYTGYLKRATSQNIVLGGLAGAAPPLLGWTAMSNQVTPEALLLVLIIFTWTPPHFWALAIYRCEEYQKAKIPMLPVTHGIAYTKTSILVYTLLLCIVSLLPYFWGLSGRLYLLAALLLGARYLYWSIVLYYSEDRKNAMRSFRFSIIYLMSLFLFLLLDHWV